jgi:hypothetical protein
VRVGGQLPATQVPRKVVRQFGAMTPKSAHERVHIDWLNLGIEGASIFEVFFPLLNWSLRRWRN